MYKINQLKCVRMIYTKFLIYNVCLGIMVFNNVVIIKPETIMISYELIKLEQ